MAKKLKYKSNITATLATIWTGLTFFSGISGYILQTDLTILIVTAFSFGAVLTIASYMYDLKRIELFLKLLEIELTNDEDIEIEVSMAEDEEAGE